MVNYEMRKAGQKKVERFEAVSIGQQRHRSTTKHGDDKHIYDLIIDLGNGSTRLISAVAWCHKSSD